MRYTVQWRYYSSLCDLHGLGRLEPGTFLDVAPEVAAAINADSPGVLGIPAPEPQAPVERAATGAVNRQARGGRNRAAGA